jgi:UDP-3-O-[3-hydroxymyristoyl] glucosamine N-acyltransferase
MQITVRELGILLNGEIHGDENAIIDKVAKIEEGSQGALSFLANPKYEQYIYNTLSSAVIVNKSFSPSQSLKTTLIKVDDAYSSFTFLLEKFGTTTSDLIGIESTAVLMPQVQVGKDAFIDHLTYVGKGSKIGDNTKIFSGVSIGKNVAIGSNTIIYAGVKIYDDCVIGNNCIIHSGTVIGSDGFGFAPQADKSYKKIPQTGNVIIHDDVEIGANCSIDRATMGSTIICKGVKLDNLIQIAHNVEIGEHTVIASQSGVAGSTKIGKYCIIAGQVGFVGHITIADGSVFGAQSGVSSHVKEPGKRWFGSPAFEYKDALKSIVIHKQLPAMEKRIAELESIIKQLTNIEQK